MTLTPSTLRLDLKCGRGAISEGEKCHVGPATKVQEKSAAKKSESKGLTGKQKAQVAGLVAYAALGAASLYQLKNIRKAYWEIPVTCSIISLVRTNKPDLLYSVT